MKRLSGIHITPPALAVEPPTRSVFSRISTLLPALRSTRPAHIEPPPLPTTTKSKVSSIARTSSRSAAQGDGSAAQWRGERVGERWERASSHPRYLSGRQDAWETVK